MSEKDDEFDLVPVELIGTLGIPIPIPGGFKQGKNVCIGCGVDITEENDSGWEGFCDDGLTTQPICILCDGVWKPDWAKEGAKINIGEEENPPLLH